MTFKEASGISSFIFQDEENPYTSRTIMISASTLISTTFRHQAWRSESENHFLDPEVHCCEDNIKTTVCGGVLHSSQVRAHLVGSRKHGIKHSDSIKCTISAYRFSHYQLLKRGFCSIDSVTFRSWLWHYAKPEGRRFDSRYHCTFQ
jgi:hypothetical protein